MFESILAFVFLHSHPACMLHTYNLGFTLWLQNETSPYKNTEAGPNTWEAGDVSEAQAANGSRA